VNEVCGIRDMEICYYCVIFFTFLLMSIITLYYNHGGNWLRLKGLDRSL
jgi:hypothetical protein